jgi:hypothetical protein
MSLVVVREGCGAALLHRQAGLSSVERLDLALLVNRQNDGVVRRIDIKADDVAQLGDELRVIGELEPTHSVRLQAVGPPDALYRTDADPDRFGHGCARPMGGVLGRSRQGVKATTRLATSEANGGMREGRVLSRHWQATPSALKRSCQRQMTVLAFPVRRMISAVPWPSAVSKTILARQTCF